MVNATLCLCVELCLLWLLYGWNFVSEHYNWKFCWLLPNVWQICVILHSLKICHSIIKYVSILSFHWYDPLLNNTHNFSFSNMRQITKLLKFFLKKVFTLEKYFLASILIGPWFWFLISKPVAWFFCFLC